MKAQTPALSSERIPILDSRRWDSILHAVRRFPDRLHERRFWNVQALLLLATLPHYGIEASGDAFETLESWQLNSVVVSLYILPLLYAAINYRSEGAALTALWAAVLVSPSMWYWDRSVSHWTTELAQLSVVLPVGLLVAWRVEIETRQRRLAEQTSANLSLLNQIGETLSNTLEVERQLPGVVERVRSSLALDSVWLCLEAASADKRLMVIEDAAGPERPAPTPSPEELHARATAAGSTMREPECLVVPLLSESRVRGSLGVTSDRPESLTEEASELLSTIANQIRVAVENARLTRERQESMKSYVRQVTAAQEEERLRIARELHDETSQELVYAVRNLELFGGSATPDQREFVDDIRDRLRETLRSIRRFGRDLRPSVLDDLGLVAAIETIVQEADSRLAAAARLDVTGTAQRLDATVELALFRIAQEAVRNVERHAGARSLTVGLAFGSEEVRLSVIDDGAGFSVPGNIADFAHEGKLGMLGMKERAELVGGTFEVGPAGDRGTQVLVIVKRPAAGSKTEDSSSSTDAG